MEKNVAIVRAHSEYEECDAEIVRKLRAMFWRNNVPTATAVRR